MKRIVATLILAAIFLAACVPAPAPTPLVEPSPAPTQTAAPALPSATPNPSDTPAPSPTSMPSATSAPNPTTPTYLELGASPTAAAAGLPFEMTIQTDGVFKNPFDPADANLQVRFTPPEGAPVLVPAFWTQEYDPQTMQPSGLPGWRVRFTPSLPGKWTVQAVLDAPAVQSVEQTFSVAPNADAAGFVRINARNPLYFGYDNGATFYPVGLNIGWGGEQTLADYQRWMDRLAAQGGTIMRVWMASWSFGLEWNDTPLGDYTARLQRAWMLDEVFRMAEQRGIKIVLVLLNHGMFSATVNPQWHENPLNAVNGGPLQKPEEFATNPEARRLFAQRLRYVAARWAYSPSLMAWEWWNEEDWTPITPALLIPWIQEMTPILHANDPYHHLITTSFAQSSVPEVANLPEIDFAELHLYDASDPVLNFPDLYEVWRLQIPAKPILFGEFGNSAGIENTSSLDQHGLHLHNSLWASTFSGFSSTAMYWWWDLYIDPLDLWPVYGRLTRFLAGEDLAAYQAGKAVLSTRNLPYRVLSAPDRQLIYLHDRAFDVSFMERAIGQMIITQTTPEPGWQYLPEAISGQTLTLSGLEDGQYVLYWYSPNQGQWLQNEPVTVKDGEATVNIPTFQGDLAAKVLPADAPPPK